MQYSNRFDNDPNKPSLRKVCSNAIGNASMISNTASFAFYMPNVLAELYIRRNYIIWRE